ncbi:MAG: hypothetical protein M3367_03235 [Acidobacteriota bacterium]|nr:hypothetical protein [Acidobacteriota bacterium]
MSKIRRPQFANDRVHKEVREMAEEYLKTKGSFSFDEVLEKVGFEGLSDYIQWTFIYEYLAERNFALIPVNDLFFRPIRDRYIKYESGEKVKHVDASPQLFIAWGRGKTIKGYVTEQAAPPSIIAAYVNTRNKLIEGGGITMAARLNRMIDDGVIVPNPVLLNDHIDGNAGGFRFLDHRQNKSLVKKADV